MKLTVLIIMSFILFSTSILSQESLILKKPIWETKVVLSSDTAIEHAAIFELKDSSIVISSATLKKDYLIGNYSIQKLYIPQIRMIQSKRRRGLLHGMVIGTGFGLLTGCLFATMVRDDRPCIQDGSLRNYFCEATWTSAEDKVGPTVLIPTVLGMLAGGLFGSISFTIPIDGSIEKYNRNKKKLAKYSIKK